MEWTTIINGFFALICGVDLVKLVTLKQTRTAKEIDNTSKLINLQNEALDRKKKEAEENAAEIKQLKNQVVSMQNQIIKLQGEVSSMRVGYEQSQVFRCDVIGCKKRIPPFNKEKYNELTGENESK